MRRLEDTKIVKAPENNKERGATMVEYAVMVALIVVAVIATVRTLGTNVNTTLSNVANQVGN